MPVQRRLSKGSRLAIALFSIHWCAVGRVSPPLGRVVVLEPCGFQLVTTHGGIDVWSVPSRKWILTLVWELFSDMPILRRKGLSELHGETLFPHAKHFSKANNKWLEAGSWRRVLWFIIVLVFQMMQYQRIFLLFKRLWIRSFLVCPTRVWSR